MFFYFERKIQNVILSVTTKRYNTNILNLLISGDNDNEKLA